MVKLTKITTKERLDEYSAYCIQGGFQYDEHNEAPVNELVSAFDQKKSGVIVFGGAGSGKTLLFSMLQRITHPQDWKSFVRKNVLDVVIDFNENGHGVFQNWKNKNILFDDLGTEEMGRYYGDKVEVFEKIIQLRYELFQSHGLLTHFTTNLTQQEIQNRYGLRCVSRLKEMSSSVFLGVGKGHKDRRPMKNYIGLPQVFHAPIKSQEDLDWEKKYAAMTKMMQSEPTPPVPGLGSRMKNHFDSWAPEPEVEPQAEIK